MSDSASHPSGGGARLRVFVAGSALFAAACASDAQVLLDAPPAELDGVAVTEKLGDQLPTRLTFTNSRGERVPLSRYFDGAKPVVLALVYFDCPIVCTLVLDRLTECFSGLDYTIGQDYNVVVVSIDHTEGVTESESRKQRDMAVYGRENPGAIAEGWAYLTGDKTSIRMLADACGWDFNQLPSGEFAHPAAVMIASPDGKLTRYIYGFDYPVKQVKLSLLDASEGRIAASLGDRLLFYCYRYDPTAGAYSMQAMALMRLAGVATVAGLVALIGGMLIYEKIRGKKPMAAAA